MTDYDSAYKDFFTHPEMVEGLRKDFVSEEWVSELDFSTLARYPNSFIPDIAATRGAGNQYA